MVEGVDYSYSRPDPVCLFNSGKRFAVRYVTSGEFGKDISRAEANRLIAAGLKVAIVYQTSAGFMLKGYEAGQGAARAGHAEAVQAGMPPRRPIYFALDIDPRPLSNRQWDAIKAFCNGAASVLGRSRVGLYGGLKAIDVLVPGFATWGWQTYAWSEGRWSAKAHLRQYLNGQNLCGGEVDLCRSMTTDYGQWPIQEDDMTPEEHEWLRQVRASVVPQAEVTDARFQIRTHIQRELVENNARLRAIIREETADAIDVADLAQRIAAALPPGSVDQPTVEAGVRAVIPELVDAVGDNLSARLQG